MADATTDEARLQAEAFKADGNALLAERKYREAVEMYSRAIELDPDNAVYYSNRSAAYLALGDERGSALRDAEKCIALKPEWWKGYSRKGAAEHALLRFDAARATYQMGLRFDPDNASLLQAAEDAYAAGQDHSRRLREAAQADEQRRKEAEAARAAQEKHEAEKEKEKPIKADVTDEDALLAEFMSEVQELEENSNCIKKEEKPAERAPVDFGDSDGQLTRLLQPHYEWINLNPFRVLMLETDATEDDIKQHYRKISTLVHPDKCRHPRAREAFEQVTKAHDTLLNEDRRKTFVRLIANTRERVEKERRQKLKKGVKETELGDLTEEQDKAVIKAFAEMEHRRVNLEKREAAQKRREAEQQEKQQQQTVEMFKRERSWAEEDRREHRVGNWRDFQKGGKRRKEMDAQGRKEERIGEKKFGAAENDQYKKNWK